jgi:hypothetical protein
VRLVFPLFSILLSFFAGPRDPLSLRQGAILVAVS